MAACLDPAQVIAFVRGGDEAARLSVEEHIDDCEACRARVAAAAAHAYDGDHPALTTDVDALAGSTLGRYTLGERLGAGGIGVVYRAEDVQLHRRVVIKLLRPELERSGHRARLLREAQAMAQLSHPNVVQVYDLGNFDDSVYVAMEYLDGGDLRAWLADRPRSRREILDVFLQAAHGLAAAHAIGIVHRDFKPANVVVSADGRVKVTDFGLARSVTDAEDAGLAVGTPAYMSPEQAAGGLVDARSDQYGFCIALYEALEQVGPTAIVDASGRVRPPRQIPRRVASALRRGLARRAEDRFPTMPALIAALSPRRSVAIVALAVALIALAAAGGAWLTLGERVADPCPGGELAIWSPARADRLAARLRAGPASNHAGEILAAIADRAQVWRTLHLGTCTDPDELRARRRACLDRRAGELAAVLDRAEQMSPDEHVALPGLVRRLEPIAPCASVAALETEPIAPPAKLRAQLLAVRERIAAAEGTGTHAGTTQALAAARAIATSAQALPSAPLEAEALVYLGEVELAAGAPADAVTSFTAAVQRALAGNAVALRGAALVGLVRAYHAHHRPADALRWAGLAELAIRRLHAPDPLELQLAGEILQLAPARAPEITAHLATRLPPVARDDAPLGLGNACTPAEDLRVHLALDETRGTHARDSSGLGHDGTLLGAGAPTWVAGRRGGALDLDGFKDAIDLGAPPDLTDLAALTTCAWIFPRRYPSSYPAIADKSTDTYQGGWNFYIQTDGTIGLLTPYRDWYETGLVHLDTWTHVCATWNGAPGPNSVTIYQDGAALAPRDKGTNREGASRDVAAATRDHDAANKLFIGRVNNGKYYFDGHIDDFQLYARALPWPEIMAIHDCAFVTP